jgi:transposase-like protein
MLEGIIISGIKSSAEKPGRIPVAVDGIQVNFCKNPSCPNFGVPPKSVVSRGRPTAGSQLDTYTLQVSGRNTPEILCTVCGEQPTIKSNAAIAEELARFQRDLVIAPDPSCPDESCTNHAIPIGTGKNYQSIGLSPSGSRRYRCKVCRKTFSVGKSTTGHKAPHKNRLIFSLLMNKEPMRRICEVADVDPKTLYGKIEFLYRQSLSFAADREQRLLKGMNISRLHLGVDRQEYVVNWTRHVDRRNVKLSAVGTADNTTSYVFGMHLNYDASLDSEVVEADAIASDDYQTRPPFRRYARVWLKELQLIRKPCQQPQKAQQARIAG